MSKKKQSRKEKRVLAAALLVAGVITAGSTFAWFTSKDEVTNRLSASAKYDVSIAEDFQPPEDWIPGQTINKDVSAVNTGNVDAFVRMWLGGQMRLLSETTPSVDASTGTPTASLTATTDQDKIDLGLTYYNGTTYYKTLSTEKIDNPKDADHAAAGTETANPVSGENTPAQFSEVQSMMAGGVLVYAPADASYTWTLEQATELKVGTYTNNTVTNVAKGTTVGSEKSSAATKIAGVSSTNANYYGSIDASTFAPQTTGLYLFRRNVAETADGTANKYEYSGYYYDATLNKYFALHTGTGDNGHSDYVLPTGAVTENNSATPSADQVLPVTVAANKVYLYTASEQVLDTDDLTWTYDNTEGSEKFTVKANADKISIDIALANIGGGSEAWTAITDTTDPYKTTFYYNNDVEAGDTTKKLVDSVTLSGATEKDAYLAFDFDLDVFLDSIQVTVDEAGNEGFGTVSSGWAVAAGDNATAAKATGTTGTPEIETITWTNV